MPVALCVKAGRRRLARSRARCNNSSLYHDGLSCPNGCLLSVINRCADRRAPNTLEIELQYIIQWFEAKFNSGTVKKKILLPDIYFKDLHNIIFIK